MNQEIRTGQSLWEPVTRQSLLQENSFKRGEGVEPLLGGFDPKPLMSQNFVFATPGC